MCHDAVGNVLVLPQRLASPTHIADATDAIDDAHAVSMAGAQFRQQLWVQRSCRLVGEVLLIRHLDGCRRVVVSHTPILDEDAGHTVGRRCHDVALVESKVGRALVEQSVPVLRSGLAAQSQMPFADGRRPVASLPKHVSECELLRADDHPCIPSRHISALPPEGILPREQSVARRRARRGAGVGVGEAHATCRQPVDARCLHLRGTVARQVAIPQVVGNDEDHVRPFLCRRCRWHHRQQRRVLQTYREYRGGLLKRPFSCRERQNPFHVLR